MARALAQALPLWAFGLVVAGWMTGVRRQRAKAQRSSRLARVDALTNLRNRRALEEALPEAVSLARRAHQPLSVLVADLDALAHCRRQALPRLAQSCRTPEGRPLRIPSGSPSSVA